MNVLRLFRVLAFEPHGKDKVRGPEARGTLALLGEDAGPCEKARFIRDIDNGVLEFDINSFLVVPMIPQNDTIILELKDGLSHKFVAYKEIPAAEKTHISILKARVNPVAR